MNDTRRPDWGWRTTALPGAAAIRAEVDRGDRPASVAEVLQGWRCDEAFRRAWSQWLAGLPMASYCWELPPLTVGRLARPFECVFVESPALAVPLADPAPFEEFFPACPGDREAVIFPNLGGDALLVVPTPQGDVAAYPHLARFLRTAPASQVASIWQFVAEAVDQRLGDDPLWLSTAGLGVAWLHVRIDSSPKYFRYRPYAHAH